MKIIRYSPNRPRMGGLALFFVVSIFGADSNWVWGDQRPAYQAGGRISSLVHVSHYQGTLIARFASDHQINIIIRPVNLEAPGLSVRGHPPKPIQIKYKTLGPLDEAIGGPKGDRAQGRVAVFNPVKPNKEKYQKRYEERRQEWKDANQPAEKASTPDDLVQQLKGESEIQALVRLKLIRRLEDARSEEGLQFSTKEGGFVISPSTGKSYTGDVDLFEIRGKDGGQLEKAAKKKFVELLVNDPKIDVMHGVHVDWDLHKPRDEAISRRIREKHMKETDKHEALIKVTPDFEVCQVWGPGQDEDATHKYACISDAEAQNKASPNQDPKERGKPDPDAKPGKSSDKPRDPVESKPVTPPPHGPKPQYGAGATLWLSTSPAADPGACYRDVCYHVRITKVEVSDSNFEYVYTYEDVDVDPTVVHGSQTGDAPVIESHVCKEVIDRPQPRAN